MKSTTMVHTRVENGVHKRLKLIGALEGTSIQRIVTEAVERHLVRFYEPSPAGLSLEQICANHAAATAAGFPFRLTPEEQRARMEKQQRSVHTFAEVKDELVAKVMALTAPEQGTATSEPGSRVDQACVKVGEKLVAEAKALTPKGEPNQEAAHD